MDWILFFILAGVLLVGLYVNLINAPGLWVMVLAALGYGWATQWQFIGVKTLVTILVLAVIAEGLEFLASGAAAKRAGASRRGIMGAILGGVLGGIFLTVSIWIPGLGTILGVCLGTFIGALAGEATAGSELGPSLRIGLGAVKGRLIGMFIKLLFGCTIMGIVLCIAFPISFHRPKPAIVEPPTSAPATTAPVQ